MLLKHECTKGKGGMITYLDPKTVIAKRQTHTPLSRSVYGSKEPTCWQLQLQDKRWRRVYVILWFNAAVPYILVKGEKVFLGSYDYTY